MNTCCERLVIAAPHRVGSPDTDRSVELLASGVVTMKRKPAIDADLTPRKVEKTDEQWREQLTAEQYRVLRRKGTERAYTGKYFDETRPGTYICAGCGAELFSSDTKYKSGTGWPSFTEPADEANVELHRDFRYLMYRVEVSCAACGGHLGHVFRDGHTDTRKRYCINSCSLELKRPPER
jgi:peptide-methionine (R)-S-oxide reductase